MIKVIGYTFTAAVHCVECTRRAVDAGELFTEYAGPGERDENSIRLDLRDREGNNVRPVFSTDEGAHAETCDDCREGLAP